MERVIWIRFKSTNVPNVLSNNFLFQMIYQISTYVILNSSIKINERNSPLFKYLRLKCSLCHQVLHHLYQCDFLQLNKKVAKGVFYAL